MSRLFGWDLPPGVSSADIERAYGWDDPPPPLRCVACGAFLANKPDETDYREDAVECDGTETFHDEPYGEDAIAILGEEFRGKTYRVSVSACGVEVGKHDPHRDVLWASEVRYRKCRRCREINADAD